MGQKPTPNHRRQRMKIHETVSLSFSLSEPAHNSFWESSPKKVRIFYKCKIDLLVFLKRYPQGSLTENTILLKLANISQHLKTLLFKTSFLPLLNKKASTLSKTPCRASSVTQKDLVEIIRDYSHLGKITSYPPNQR